MATREQLRKLLQERRQRLQRELQDLEEQQEPTRDARLAREQTGYGNHMADDATQTFEDEKELALRQHLAGMLGQVEEALRRVESGSYGCCDNCGREIDPARLEAIPWATRCLRCQAGSESRH